MLGLVVRVSMHGFLWFKIFLYFIYFWLCWVFVAVCELSLLEAGRGNFLAVVHRLLSLPGVGSRACGPQASRLMGSGAHGLRTYSAWA